MVVLIGGSGTLSNGRMDHRQHGPLCVPPAPNFPVKSSAGVFSAGGLKCVRGPTHACPDPWAHPSLPQRGVPTHTVFWGAQERPPNVWSTACNRPQSDHNRRQLYPNRRQLYPNRLQLDRDCRQSEPRLVYWGMGCRARLQCFVSSVLYCCC